MTAPHGRWWSISTAPGPASQLIPSRSDPPLVHGYTIVAGGLNSPLTRATPLPADTGRIYITVGFRDYMWSTTRTLVEFLDSHDYPADQLWQRQANTGHELYDWHYHEAFQWLDRGSRPDPGTLNSGWTRDAGFTGTESLIVLARDRADRINVAGEGAIYRREPTGSWTRTAQLGGGAIPPHLNGLCFLDDNRGVAVGEGKVYRTDDGASWALGAAVPELGAQGFGVSYLNGLACAGQALVAGGVWSAVTASTVDRVGQRDR